MGLLEEVSAGWGLPICKKLIDSHPAFFWGGIAGIPLIFFIRWGWLRAAAWLLESKDNSGVQPLLLPVTRAISPSPGRVKRSTRKFQGLRKKKKHDVYSFNSWLWLQVLFKQG